MQGGIWLLSALVLNMGVLPQSAAGKIMLDQMSDARMEQLIPGSTA
jgi:DNA-binding IclR family transcriptional regulator